MDDDLITPAVLESLAGTQRLSAWRSVFFRRRGRAIAAD
jgi:hypothetical protein